MGSQRWRQTGTTTEPIFWLLRKLLSIAQRGSAAWRIPLTFRVVYHEVTEDGAAKKQMRPEQIAWQNKKFLDDASENEKLDGLFRGCNLEKHFGIHRVHEKCRRHKREQNTLKWIGKICRS